MLKKMGFHLWATESEFILVAHLQYLLSKSSQKKTETTFIVTYLCTFRMVIQFTPITMDIISTWDSMTWVN